MDFRHPSAIRQELSRHVNLRHKVDEALKAPDLAPASAVVAEQAKLFTQGVIAALEWALCARTEIEPEETDDGPPALP